MIEYALILGFVFVLYLLVKNIGKTFPLFELTAVLYLVQYGIAPMFMYSYGEQGNMAVPKETYFPFITLACFSFIAGLFVFRPKIRLSGMTVDRDLASKLGRIFFAIGIGGSIALLILPESLKSIVNFFIILKWPGVFSLVFSNKKIDKLFVVIVFLEISISAILNALLIEFIVFSVFLVMFVSLRYKISFQIKLGLVFVGLLFLTIYQGVKADYRESVWQNNFTVEEKVALLSELITIDSFREAFNADINNNESVIETMHRLNQGWQTSMVMYNVPDVVPFENGDAIADDIMSSLLPRLIYPDKRVVNDYKRFNYYTGYNLNEKTAMTIGVLGDIYIDFGFYLSLPVLFILGMFFSRVSFWFYKTFIAKNPLNLIWLPFLFSYLIRPGNELYMVLNHLIKALIVFYVVKTIVYPVLMKNLNQNKEIARSN